MLERSAGILIHPTSLPGRFAVGDLGPEVDLLLDWLRAAGQTWWQILPLGPPEAHNSPYNCLSAFAGNPLLISPELLVEDGLLTPAELEDAPESPPGIVDFEVAARWKEPLLRRAWSRFSSTAGPEMRDDLAAFEASAEAQWLSDWTLFAALRGHYEGRGWWDWDPEIARRDEAALVEARRRLAEETAYLGFLQWLFFRQWRRVREAAHERNLRILGDLPIYVAHNCAEVWARPELFDLDASGRPLSVAGVPPDYFSETGQLWGNPIYRWDVLAEEGYAWWIARLTANLRLADLVRLDHFRAFASFWKVRSDEETAMHGEWAEGPRKAFFDAVKEALGDLPLVAEDLGEITEDVEELLAALGLPGMRVLQFGFGDPQSIHAPHRLEKSSVAYTGTHDNDTIKSWYHGLEAEERSVVHDYCGLSGNDSNEGIHWHLIRLLYTSVADLAVVPMQDVLGLGGEARMNTPALSEGNWAWRLEEAAIGPETADRLQRLATISGRYSSEPA